MNIDYIVQLWKEATGIDASTHIRLGVNSDMVCHKAIESLKKDPSGLLAILFMRQAFDELVKETTFTLEDIMNNVDISRFIALKDALYSEECSNVCDYIVNGLIDNIRVLGKSYTYDEIVKTNAFYEVVADAVQDFNNEHKIIHEQHCDGQPIHCNNARVLPKLYKFEYLKLFVDALKSAPQDNFACVAIIDRTFETCDSTYDEKYDKFFCIGIKNNGIVYTISDRIIIRANDSYTYKHRNPGRDYANKVDYSWLPYCKMNDILNNVDTSRMLTDGTSSNSPSNLGSLFDDEGIIYLGTLLTLAYHKYFIAPEDISAKRVFFSSDVKFLPATSCTAVVVADQVQIPMPNERLKADASPNDVYTNNLYDYYIDKYPLPPLPPMPASDKLSTLEEYQKQAWWSVRRAQADNIKECLCNSIKTNLRKTEDWLQSLINKNIDKIINYMLTTVPYDDFVKKYGNPDSKDSDKPIFWKEFAAGNDVPASALYYEEKYDSVDPCNYVKINDTVSRRVDYNYYANAFILNNDCKSRKWHVKLILRSHTDLEKFFNLTNEELPEDIRRWFNARTNCGMYSWKPYSGNSILNVTDPMNDIDNPWEREFSCCIHLYVSKSMLKKYHPQWFKNNNCVDALNND